MKSTCKFALRICRPLEKVKQSAPFCRPTVRKVLCLQGFADMTNRGAHRRSPVVESRENVGFDLLRGKDVQGGEIHIGFINRLQLIVKSLGPAQPVNGLIHERDKLL